MGSYKGSDTHTQDSPSVVRRGLVGKEAPPPRSGTYSGTAPNDPDNKKAVYIGTNVEYAGYVHEGTDKMAPNRFLKNALEKNKGELEKIISDVLRKSMS
jgi:HK97 gp10 family phage protein